jgi:hypothetical protein
MINHTETLSFITPLVDLPGDKKPKPFSAPTKDKPVIYKDSKLPFLTNLYVASLTVVGLFIVFRFVQKSR